MRTQSSRVPLSCAHCGAPFSPRRPSDRARARYCSPACGYAARKASRGTPAEWFWSKVDRDGPVPSHRPELGPCWLWTGPTLAQGYGLFFDGERNVRAHRFAEIEANGPLPDGLDALHHCDNPPCVRNGSDGLPSHLFRGTALDNARDCVAKGRKPTDEQHWSIQKPDLVLRGEQNGRAKLTWDQVRDIRRLYAAGGTSYPRLARMFGVNHGTIHQIVKGTTWKEQQP